MSKKKDEEVHYEVKGRKVVKITTKENKKRGTRSAYSEFVGNAKDLAPLLKKLRKEKLLKEDKKPPKEEDK